MVKSKGSKSTKKVERRVADMKKQAFNPGGQKGKLHREIGVPVGKKIPAKKLAAAAKSKNPEIRRDAVRAQTMKKWNHRGAK